jgi:hypothetical protein
MWRCLSASTVEPQGKLLVIQMAQSTLPCSPAGVKTTIEQVGKRQARDDVLLETWDHGTPHQELRVNLHLVLLRLEQLNGDHAKNEEMSGLQELEKTGKRTLLSEDVLKHRN